MSDALNHSPPKQNSQANKGKQLPIVPLADQLTWSRKEAAKMCGVCPETFSKWVREGFMPQPLKNGRFSADAIRRRLADNGGGTPPSAYDRWKAAS